MVYLDYGLMFTGADCPVVLRFLGLGASNKSLSSGVSVSISVFIKTKSLHKNIQASNVLH